MDPKFQEELEKAKKILEDSGDEEFVPPPLAGNEEENTAWWAKRWQKRQAEVPQANDNLNLDEPT